MTAPANNTQASVNLRDISRRHFLSTATLATTGFTLAPNLPHAAEASAATHLRKKALIAITLDLEMARNFPQWEDSHWDYEKGNLTDEVKQYALQAARIVKAHGGRIHFFLVCRALEQENVDWLKELIREGHPIGSHTYDHVYLLAKKPEEVQYRFQRAPWLIEGKTPAEIIRENIQLATAAMKTRLGISPVGFRAPGGFADGLSGRPDIQKMLLDAGFVWASTKYPAHPNSEPGKEPEPAILEGIVKSQVAAQPFTYPTGLVEIPMSPISDIGAFRNGKWSVDLFLKSTQMSVEWAIRNQAIFDFLGHPAVLSVKDPEFRAIKLICELANHEAGQAEMVTLERIFEAVSRA